MRLKPEPNTKDAITSRTTPGGSDLHEAQHRDLRVFSLGEQQSCSIGAKAAPRARWSSLKRRLEDSPCADVATPPLGGSDGHDSEGQWGKRQWGGSGAGTVYARSAVLRQHLVGLPYTGVAATPPGDSGDHDLEVQREEWQRHGIGSGAACARSALLRHRLEGSPCTGPATPPKRARWGRAADDDAAAYASTTAGAATVANATLPKQARWGGAACSEASTLPGASAGAATIAPAALVARACYRTSIAVATAAWPPIAAAAATTAAVAAGGVTGTAAGVAAAPAPTATYPLQPAKLQEHTGSSSLVGLHGQEQALPLQSSTKHGVISSKPPAHQPGQALCLYSGGASRPVVLPGQNQALPTECPSNTLTREGAGQPLYGRGSRPFVQRSGQLHLAHDGRDSASCKQQAGQPPHLHWECRDSRLPVQQPGQPLHLAHGGRASGSSQQQAGQPRHSHRGGSGSAYRNQLQQAPEVTCCLWGDCVYAEDAWSGRAAPVRTYPWLK